LYIFEEETVCSYGLEATLLHHNQFMSSFNKKCIADILVHTSTDSYYAVHWNRKTPDSEFPIMVTSVCRCTYYSA